MALNSHRVSAAAGLALGLVIAGCAGWLLADSPVRQQTIDQGGFRLCPPTVWEMLGVQCDDTRGGYYILLAIGVIIAGRSALLLMPKEPNQ